MKKSRVSKVTQVLGQARESLKLLETLEKETLAKARTFVRFPKVSAKGSAAHDKLLARLKSMGIATRSEVEALEKRVDSLQKELTTLVAALASDASASQAKRGTNKNTSRSAESFPNT